MSKLGSLKNLAWEASETTIGQPLRFASGVRKSFVITGAEDRGNTSFGAISKCPRQGAFTHEIL